MGTRSASQTLSTYCVTRITRARYGLRNFRTQSKSTVQASCTLCVSQNGLSHPPQPSYTLCARYHQTCGEVNLVITLIRKRECEVYVLREITESVVSTPQSLINELQRQFGPQLVPTTYFPVDYMKM